MSLVARRYARALAEILFAAKLPPAERRQTVQQTKQHLTDISDLIDQNADLRAVLTSPAVPREQKLGVLEGLRSLLGFSALTRNFLGVLLEHRRIELLGQVVAAFDQEVYERLGIVPVEITTAAALNAKQKRSLEERLEALLKSTVEMRFREDPAVLAGAVARMGSTIYDASLRAQLRRLQRQLSTESR